MMDNREVIALAKSLGVVVRDVVAATVAELGKAWRAELDRRIKEIPPAERGEQGPPGKDGKDGPQGIPGESIAGPPGKDGLSGIGQKGEPGENGRDGIDGKDGAPGPMGPPGERGETGAQGPPGQTIKGDTGAPGRDGKDAEPIHPDTVALMVLQAVEKAVAAIPRAKDGESGRDALAIEILPAINPAKSYPPRTYAVHAGGTVMSSKWTTAGDSVDMSEWLVVMNGFAAERIEQGEDPGSILIEHTMTNGAVISKQLHYPAMVYRDVWRDGVEYRKGNTVTYGSSVWHCNVTGTKAKPGLPPFEDWTLCVKAVRGKDGLPGKDGERGPEGKPGRDLSFR